jgi:hypothetical protein
MDRAVHTSRLLLAKPATIESNRGVIKQFLALCAEKFTWLVMVPAMQPDHRPKRFPLPREPGIRERRRCPSITRARCLSSPACQSLNHFHQYI